MYTTIMVTRSSQRTRKRVHTDRLVAEMLVSPWPLPTPQSVREEPESETNQRKAEQMSALPPNQHDMISRA